MTATHTVRGCVGGGGGGGGECRGAQSARCFCRACGARVCCVCQLAHGPEPHHPTTLVSQPPLHTRPPPTSPISPPAHRSVCAGGAGTGRRRAHHPKRARGQQGGPVRGVGADGAGAVYGGAWGELSVCGPLRAAAPIHGSARARPFLTTPFYLVAPSAPFHPPLLFLPLLSPHSFPFSVCLPLPHPPTPPTAPQSALGAQLASAGGLRALHDAVTSRGDIWARRAACKSLYTLGRRAHLMADSGGLAWGDVTTALERAGKEDFVCARWAKAARGWKAQSDSKARVASWFLDGEEEEGGGAPASASPAEEGGK